MKVPIGTSGGHYRQECPLRAYHRRVLTDPGPAVEAHSRPARFRWIVGAGLVGALIVGAMAGWAAHGSGNDVRVVRGTVGNVTGDGVGISVDNEGYLIGTGLTWRGLDGSWREGGQPECLAPLTSGAEVELGIMAVPDRHEAGGRPNHVVWVKCL